MVDAEFLHDLRGLGTRYRIGREWDMFCPDPRHPVGLPGRGCFAFAGRGAVITLRVPSGEFRDAQGSGLTRRRVLLPVRRRNRALRRFLSCLAIRGFAGASRISLLRPALPVDSLTRFKMRCYTRLVGVADGPGLSRPF